MRFVRGFLFFCLTLVVCAASAVAAPRAGHIFIISIDGGKPSVIQDSRMPVLQATIHNGAVSWNARTVFPSITLVAHASMLTGVTPAKHGITWNSWKPDKGFVQAPTVFSLAKAHGFRTAMFVGKDKLKHLAVPGTLDMYACPEYSQAVVAGEASAHIVSNRPQLCFIHFADGDGAGHSHGWGSPEQKRVFAEGDYALGIIMEVLDRLELLADSVIIVTADHGGHDKEHGTDGPDDMTIFWAAYGKGVKPGYVVTAPVSTCDTAATALWLLDIPIPADWDGHPVTSAFVEP